ncbi:hypothetical protein AWENTII_002345 [Aspergillus wentii]
MTLDILPATNANGTTAQFRMALVEGTMLLALSNYALEKLRHDMAVDPEESDSYDEWDSDGYNGKRKAKGPAGGPPIKRRLGVAPKPNRVHLHWAGRAPEADIEIGQEEKHTGFLDFDASKATVHGEWVHPNFFGDESIPFTIYKCADEPAKRPEKRSFYSEKQYDYESDTRWGRYR